MSWRFPRFPTKANRVPSVDDMNENFFEFVEEIGGRLNEHNWAANAISAKADVAQDACFVWHSDDNDPSTQFPSAAIGALGDGDVRVPQRSSWRVIKSVTFTSPACLLWIHSSLQITQDPDDPANNYWTTDSKFNYALSGIQVDGYVIPETVIGGAEPDNDRAYGVRMPAVPVASSAVFPVGAGPHTVSIVVKTGAKKGGEGIHVQAAEIICLEMRR